MRKYLGSLLACAALAAVPLVMASLSVAQAPAPPAALPPTSYPMVAPSLVPAVTIDLMTPQGMDTFGAKWKTMEAKIVEGPALPGALPSYKTSYDISPHAGEKGYDDAAWPTIEAKDLAARRGGGKVSFIWYRTNLTIPAKIGEFDTANKRAVFTAYVDDYAEVWINGEMPRRAGIPSPATIQGFNIPNRVMLGETVKAGDKFQLAVFGINGPISVAPPNFVFWREAKVEFYP